jgi:hypothetical protein
MSIQPSYRNAKYINAEGWIDCEIDHPHYGWIPYTLNPDDDDQTVDNNYLLEEIIDAESFVPPTQEQLDVESAKSIRRQRDSLLSTQVDPFVCNPLRWDGLTALEQTEVTAYRNNLLNITEQETFPTSVEWPSVPTVLT